jgi:hypothetical protein
MYLASLLLFSGSFTAARDRQLSVTVYLETPTKHLHAVMVDEESFEDSEN